MLTSKLRINAIENFQKNFGGSLNVFKRRRAVTSGGEPGRDDDAFLIIRPVVYQTGLATLYSSVSLSLATK